MTDATTTTETIETSRRDGEDWLICPCGNEPDHDGFVPCDASGQEVEPTPRAWPQPLYACQRCGRIIDAATRRVVGRRP